MKFLIIFISLLHSIFLFSQPYYSFKRDIRTFKSVINNTQNNAKPETHEPQPLYYIGPEINVDSASGFYDFQTRGECRHQISRYNSTVMHAVYHTARDSMNINSTRRNVYSFSSDDGNTWTFITQVPSVTSVFNSVTSLADGSAAIITYIPLLSKSFIETDVAPGAGSFTGYETPYNIMFGNCDRLTNNKVLISGVSYRNAATDSAVVTVHDSQNHGFFYTSKFKIDQFVNQADMLITQAAGPDGKALLVIAVPNDINGNRNYNRIFTLLSTNNGETWGEPSVLYNPTILNGSFAVPYMGLDAVFDSFGNYYVAFNTTDTLGLYSSARLWVSKNGMSPVLVAQHTGTNGIPEAANTLINYQYGVCTIDNPSLSVDAGGSLIIVTFSVLFQNDILNGYNKSHIYFSTSSLSSLSFYTPIPVTTAGPGSFDERFSSIIKISPDLGGSQGITAYLVYQKDSQPGSKVLDGAPVSRARMIFRKIYGLQGATPGIIFNGSEIPERSSLGQNYPNPFNPNTIIEFKISKTSQISLEVYDVNGRLVSHIYSNTNAEAGIYKAEFNGGNLSSGVYFVRLNITEKNGKSEIFTRKMIIAK